MKRVMVTLVGASLFVASGCTSTVTLGPKANESTVLGASAGTEGASLTLPLVRGELKPATESKEE